MNLKKCNNLIRNQTSDLPACSIVPQPTMWPPTKMLEGGTIRVQKQKVIKGYERRGGKARRNVSLNIRRNERLGSCLHRVPPPPSGNKLEMYMDGHGSMSEHRGEEKNPCQEWVPGDLSRVLTRHWTVPALKRKEKCILVLITKHHI
jgi:hypothetical protein